MTKKITPVLEEEKMRSLGFTDHREGHWYYVTRLLNAVSFNLDITKETGEYKIEILNEFSLQPEDYMNMYEPHRTYVKDLIDGRIRALNGFGLTLVL